MNKKVKICGFIGTKLNDLLENNKEENKYGSLIYELIDKILELYFNYNVRAFITDCEIGTSMWCGEIVANILKNFPREVYLYNILPFKNREKNWSIKYQKRYRDLIENCNITAYLGEKYTKKCFQMKEKLIIEHSDIIFATCNLDDKNKIKRLLDKVLKKGKILILLDIKTLKCIEFY